jgi:sigma-E factor negative regulatory protein RseC
MDNPTGKIQSLIASNGAVRAVVEVDVSKACPRCAAGKGCGAGLFTGSGRKRSVEAIVGEHLSLAEGDSVEISLASDNLLKAALIVYGMPLIGAIAAAGLAYLLQLGDSAAAVAAVLGLMSGLLAGRWLLSRDECLENFVPYVEKRLQSPQFGS